MRLIFSFVGIVIVAALVMFLAKTQLSATSSLIDKAKPAGVSPPTGAAGRVPGAVDASGMAVTLPEASRQIQRNVANEVSGALQRSADARAEQANK
jgi:hypothetical protein